MLLYLYYIMKHAIIKVAYYLQNSSYIEGSI